MTSVFIGGSRAISRLNPIIRERLDDLMHRGCLILIGDAKGADKMVQQYFADQGYNLIGSGKKVLVYLSAAKSFVKLNDQSDLGRLLRQCDPREIAEAQGQISRKLSAPPQLSLTPQR